MQSGVTLRPMGLGDILDATLKLYRQNFVLFIGIQALILVPVALIQILAGAAITPRQPAQAALWFGVLIVVSLASLLPFLAMIHAASERYLGRVVTTGESYSRALSRFFPFLGASIVAGVLAGLPALTIIGIVATIYLGIRWSLLGQACVIESTGVRGSMGRSWGLVGGSWWRVFGILFVIELLVGVITLVLSGIVFGILAALGFAGGGAEGILNMFGMGARTASPALTVGSTLVSIVIGPLTPIAMTLLYYDLRVRREGFDLELQARALDQGSTGTGY